MIALLIRGASPHLAQYTSEHNLLSTDGHQETTRSAIFLLLRYWGDICFEEESWLGSDYLNIESHLT